MTSGVLASLPAGLPACLLLLRGGVGLPGHAGTPTEHTYAYRAKRPTRATRPVKPHNTYNTYNNYYLQGAGVRVVWLAAALQLLMGDSV